MPAGARELAGAVAVLGDGADPWTAAELAGLDAADAAAALDALVRGGLLEEGEPSLCFSHPLIRSSVYQDLGAADRAGPTSTRRACCARGGVARRGRRAPARSPGRPPTRQVVGVLREAARNAAALGAPRRRAYLRRALPSRRPRRHREVHGELGRAAARAGAPDAEEHLRRAVELARTTPGVAARRSSSPAG